MKARAAPLDSLRACVIAFSRTGNTQRGDFEPPVVIAVYEMPPEYDEFATYSLASARRMCAMTTTYYGVQAFVKKGNRITAEQPRTAPSEAAAKRLAEALSATRLGTIAFSRTGDADTGEYEDPVILAEHGEVPTQDEF